MERAHDEYVQIPAKQQNRKQPARMAIKAMTKAAQEHQCRRRSGPCSSAAITVLQNQTVPSQVNHTLVYERVERVE